MKHTQRDTKRFHKRHKRHKCEWPLQRGVWSPTMQFMRVAAKYLHLLSVTKLLRPSLAAYFTITWCVSCVGSVRGLLFTVCLTEAGWHSNTHLVASFHCAVQQRRNSIAPGILWAPPTVLIDGHVWSTMCLFAAARPLQTHKHTHNTWTHWLWFKGPFFKVISTFLPFRKESATLTCWCRAWNGHRGRIWPIAPTHSHVTSFLLRFLSWFICPKHICLSLFQWSILRAQTSYLLFFSSGWQR